VLQTTEIVGTKLSVTSILKPSICFLVVSSKKWYESYGIAFAKKIKNGAVITRDMQKYSSDFVLLWLVHEHQTLPFLNFVLFVIRCK